MRIEAGNSTKKLMRVVLIAGLGAGFLAGCGQTEKLKNNKGPVFEDQVFRAKVSGDKEDRTRFSITIPKVGGNIEGARQAGEFEAARYCITQYGRSDLIWEAGPDRPVESLRPVDDQLTFTGRCEGW